MIAIGLGELIAIGDGVLTRSNISFKTADSLMSVRTFLSGLLTNFTPSMIGLGIELLF
jgi:hypothetical protein